MHSFTAGNTSNSEMLEVWQVIQENIGYVYFFNRGKTAEVISDIIEHTTRNRNGSTNLLPYIKNLARNVGKRTSREEPHSPNIEDDEDNGFVFVKLQEELDFRQFAQNSELSTQLRALYLRHEENFPLLSKIYDTKFDQSIPTFDHKEASKELHRQVRKSGERVRDSLIYEDLRTIIDAFGANATFAALNVLLKEVENMTIPFYATVKEIQVKSMDKLRKTAEKITSPTIRSSEGVEYGINVNTLTMDSNPDYFNWEVIGNAKAVVKIDIAPYMEYLYDQLYVEQGVNTRLMKWCGDVHRATTPAGERLVGERIEHVIDKARAELVLSIASANIGRIVALSPDTVYLKATKDIFNKLKISTTVGKSIILPVTKK